MDINENLLKDAKELSKKDEKGKYINAQKIGNRVTLGILVIIAGIIYSFFGLEILIMSIVVLISIIFLIALVLYILIKTKVL